MTRLAKSVDAFSHGKLRNRKVGWRILQACHISGNAGPAMLSCAKLTLSQMLGHYKRRGNLVVSSTGHITLGRTSLGSGRALPMESAHAMQTGDSQCNSFTFVRSPYLLNGSVLDY